MPSASLLAARETANRQLYAAAAASGLCLVLFSCLVLSHECTELCYVSFTLKYSIVRLLYECTLSDLKAIGLVSN